MGKKPAKKTGRGKTMNAKAAQKEAAEAAAKEADVTLRMPTTNDVVNLARRKRSAKKQMAELAGTMGEAVANAAETKHLDKKAFAIATSLDALSSERLAITFPHLLRYLDDLGVPERAKAQGNMFEEEGAEAEAAEAAGDEPPPGGNVVKPGSFRRKMQEIQGENHGKPVPVAANEGRPVPEAAGAG